MNDRVYEIAAVKCDCSITLPSDGTSSDAVVLYLRDCGFSQDTELGWRQVSFSNTPSLDAIAGVIRALTQNALIVLDRTGAKGDSTFGQSIVNRMHLMELL